MPGRTVAVARELTKLYEEVLRGEPEAMAEAIAARGGLKGEITLVSPPPEGAGVLSQPEIDAKLIETMSRMISPFRLPLLRSALLGFAALALASCGGLSKMGGLLSDDAKVETPIAVPAEPVVQGSGVKVALLLPLTAPGDTGDIATGMKQAGSVRVPER